MDGSRTMDGFGWSPADPFVPTQPGEDGWCVRDSFSQLLAWPPYSDEWSRFIEAPAGRDLDRLAEYLGLTVFDFPQEWNQLIGRSAHPGIALFVFPEYKRSHAVYVDDIRWLLHHWPTPNSPPAAPGKRPLWRYGWPLGDEHLVRGPLLDAVIADERQPPRALRSC